jgi:hypothetical protein
MRKVDTSYFTQNECWGVQINGLKHCQDCKWIGISACEGKDIRQTGFNANGYRIGEDGLLAGDYNPEFDQTLSLT